MTADPEQLAAWEAALAEPVEGWSFADLDLAAEAPPWSWTTLAAAAVGGAGRVLDLGTGGGEALLALLDALGPDQRPGHVVATEGWAPNLPVAARALTPSGIAVVPYDAETHPGLPFADASFDVVLARHEAFDAVEVARVLRPGGTFLTQQVDGRDLPETRDLFGAPLLYPDVTLGSFRSQAEAAGLVVVRAEEWTGALTFGDVATLLRYAARAPWQFPDGFAVADHLDRLRTLEVLRPFDFTQQRFVVEARRPG